MLPLLQQLHVDVEPPGDTMTVLHPPRDITAVERVFRWFFSVPQWVQLGGVILAIAFGIAAVVLLVRWRRELGDWILHHHRTTPMGWKIAGAVAAFGVLLALASGGTTFYLYSQNNNQFCLSCHELHDEVYERFQLSKHHTVANLRCHDCHDEPLAAEVRQIGRWMLLRPSEVGPHAPVPRKVCAQCHIQRNPGKTWERIIATAGHSVHLSTDTAKALHIDCITCHGVSAHQFVPAARTCAQAGCHPSAAKIRLGKMAGQTALHCVACHPFTAPMQETSVLARGRGALVPALHNCLRCHAMQAQMAEYSPVIDPHKGRCGDCHDPHRQTSVAEAYKTCTNAGCHVGVDTLTPFHRGLHAGMLSQCGDCHKPHTWTVQGRACLECHQNILRQPPAGAFPAPVHGAASRTAEAASGRALWLALARHAAALGGASSSSSSARPVGHAPNPLAAFR